MAWYREGTVTATQGSTTITGTSTKFAANSRVGDAFQGTDGRWYEVVNIASDTVLSILPAYIGPSGSGLYSIAPMEGYVQESADRLRAIVNQFGNSLGFMGNPNTTAELRQNIGAASRGVNSDITSITGLTTALSVAQGGTGGKTAAEARTNLQLGTAAVSDILGSVAQSGGVPTGSIIERGSNVNGEYVKFADGTMICTRSENATRGPFTANGNVFSTTMGPIAMAMTFATTPRISVQVVSGNAHTSWVAGMGAAGSSAWGGVLLLDTTARAANSYNFHYIAIGRWF